MSESVNIIISASDQASAKLATASANIDKFGKTAKAGGKAVGAFNQILGSTPFGQYTAGLGNMIGELVEVRSKLADAAEGGKLMKVAMAGAAIAIGYQIGTMIADWIDKTEEWKEKLKDALQEAGRVADKLAGKQKSQFDQRMELAETEATPEARKAAYQAIKDETDLRIKEQQRAVKAAQEAADATAGAWTEAGKQQHEIDRQRLEIEKERVRVLMEQSAEAFRAARGPTDVEEELARRKKAADTQKRIDDERRQRAEDMWKREAEEHQRQLDRQKNAAEGAKNFWQKAEEARRATRDALLKESKENAKKASQEEADQAVADFERSMKAMDDEKARHIKKNEQINSFVKQMQNKPDLQAKESRLLSRGSGTDDPIVNVANNTKFANKSLAEMRKIQEEQLKELRKLGYKLPEPAEGF